MILNTIDSAAALESVTNKLICRYQSISSANGDSGLEDVEFWEIIIPKAFKLIFRNHMELPIETVCCVVKV